MLDDAAAAVRALHGAAPVILIDGPAGAGKSTLADQLIESWPGILRPTLVRMDEVYPGWDGLAAGSRFLHTELLAPRRAGLPAGWRRYDWSLEDRAEWHPVDPNRSLIVEGCGTLTVFNAPLADLRIWLHADDDVRKARALARDHGGFDPFWNRWQEQFERFVTEEDPVSLADLILDGTALR